MGLAPPIVKAFFWLAGNVSTVDSFRKGVLSKSIFKVCSLCGEGHNQPSISTL